MQEHLPIIEGAAVRALSEGDKLAAIKLFAAIGEICIAPMYIQPQELLSDSTKRLLWVIDGADCMEDSSGTD